MRFAFTEQQLGFRNAVRELLEKQCTPDVARSERSPELWKRLAEMGVPGLTAPVDDGGLGLDEIDLVLLLEETGRAAVPGPLMETAAVAVPVLRDAAGDELRSRWLGAIASGDAVATVGFDPTGLVSHAEHSDVLVVQEGSEVHAVPRDEVSLIPEPTFSAARPMHRVEFDPRPDTVVVSGPEGVWVIHAAFDRAALGAAAELIGIGGWLIEMAAGYAKEREQFGQPIGSFQAVKHLLANALVRLEFARPAVYRAANSVARGSEERSRDVSMAKTLASDAAMLACRTALQIHGAIGYTEEHDLHVWLKRGWALTFAWGNAAMHLDRVAQDVLEAGDPFSRRPSRVSPAPD